MLAPNSISFSEIVSLNAEQETRDDFESARPHDSDLSFDEISRPWIDMSDGKDDPTLTFEISSAPQAPITPPQVPRRSLRRVSGATSEDNNPKLPTSSAKPDRHTAKDPPETEFCEYEIGEILGEGGMGIVFGGRQAAMDRPVAIKMLRPQANSDKQRQKFLSEAILTGTLQHPNIIALHDLAVDQNDHLFYSMKRINGTPWSQSIDTMSLDENLDVFLRICNAVAFAHSRNVVHRDIKPGNVMLGEFGEVLLMDWGLAVVLPEDRPLSPDEYPGLGGTPSYMAPELAAGDFSKLGPQTDIYLLGSVLFQIVTGYPPHSGDSISEVVWNAANNEIESTTKQGELISIAHKALATDPRDRFESATELRRTVRDFQVHSQSMYLTRKARKMVKRAGRTNNYTLFANAVLTYEEAIDIWADNRKAINGLIHAKQLYVQTAIDNGDLDLAASILEGTEAINDNAARQAATLSERVSRLKQAREKETKRQARAQRDLQKWTDAFEASPDLVAISRLRDGLIFEVNNAFLRKLEYTRDQVIGKKSEELKIWVDPEQRQQFIDIIQKEGRCDEMEAWIRTRTGREMPVLMSACKLGFDGETAVIINAHDISNRKQMERALAESEMRLRETQELAKLGTWEYNLDTEEITWSDETFRIIGLSRKEGEPSLEGFLSTVHPDDAPLLLTLINKAQHDGSPYRVEVRHRQADGRYKHVLATGKPKFEGDRVVLIFGSVMDISEFRHC